MFELAPLWERAGVDLIVAIHGEGEWWSPGGVQVTDFRALNPEQTINGLVSLCIKHAYSAGYDICGIMDDDARFDIPSLAADVVRAGTWPFGGAMGPVGSYRFMARYKGNRDQPWWELDQFPMLLMGAQFYSREIMQYFLNFAWSYYRRQRRANDAFMAMLTHSMGLPVREFYVDGWHHKSSRGAGTNYDQEWYLKTLTDVAHSHNVMREFFSSQEVTPSGRPGQWYVDGVNKMAKYHLNFIHKHANKAGLKPIGTTHEQLQELIRSRGLK